MGTLTAVLLPLLGTLLMFIGEVGAIICTREMFGDTTYLNCPLPGEDIKKSYCCGPKKLRRCCTYEEYTSAINTIGVIVGALISAVVAVVIVVVISCFCCSCCLLAKRRQQRGQVIYGPAVTSTTATPYPTQPAYPIQTYSTTYPTQPAPGYQGYPPPPAAYPTPTPYPPAPDQPAYNPSYPPK